MKKDFYIIGLMSGTSLDGLDLAYCHILKENSNWKYHILETKNIAYTQQFQHKLKNSIHLSSLNLLSLHNKFGTFLGEQTQQFINEYNLKPTAISSHGHTIFHQPKQGLTYQIGSGQHIANITNLPVICDFRTGDVALGGQGAPFVPIGDFHFFSDFDFCLNLGGISNISFQKENKRIAYDIAPINMLLNYLCHKINLEYDHQGEIARKGKLNPQLLNELNALEFYRSSPPKSLGIEWFEEKMLPIINSSEDEIENLLHTAVHHIAMQIAHTVQQTSIRKGKILVTGGGAKNIFFVETLQYYLGENYFIEVPSAELIDFKEALIFAFMGVLRLEREINCLSSVTGAQKDSCSGVIYQPSSFHN
ncbi:anhydro-N-acetylmuramic acid kinase [Zhouia sp. PK063]|uniref:anhydro-N-acetylmuramic acid kinase n=1 Tax=Zhouia sp. PK063 TaxID=3373602 RepID=UPI00379598BA